MDVRENGSDLEEVIRAAVAGILKNHWTAMPTSVSEDSQDGHVATHTPTIKRAITDPTDGSITYEDHPVHPDAPIHHMGGGGISKTYPTKTGDEGLVIYAARALDSWVQSGGSQNPIEDRMHSLADGVFLSGIRSKPKMLQQVSQSSAQTRTDDKKSVIDHGPNGTHLKTVDPNTKSASDSFDPFMSATKFYETKVHPTEGHATSATDGGTTHGSTITHDAGFMAQANNGAHSFAAHPSNGTSIQSSKAHTLQAPNASLDADGNQTNNGTSKSQGAVSSAVSMGAPAGMFGGGSLGNLSFGSDGLSGPPNSNGSTAVTPELVAAPVLQANALYTVAQLNAALPPSPALTGTRAVVTDAMASASTGTGNSADSGQAMSTAPASSIAFMSILQGGGSITAPAWCDGKNWLCA